MASIYPRDRSPHLQLAIIKPDGKRVVRSLHTADPAMASKIASSTQTLVDTLTADEKARSSVLRVLVEDVFIAAGVPNPFVEEEKDCPTFSKFAVGFVNRKECEQRTKEFVTSQCLSLMMVLPSECRINKITGTDCQRWYDQMSAGITGATAKNRLAAVSSVFAQAVKLGVIPSNPCAGVQTKEVEESNKEELSDEEVAKVLAWLSGVSVVGKFQVCDWKVAVMLARYAGCRLGDAIAMKFSNIQGDVLTFVAGKTGETVTVPMCIELHRHLAIVISRGDDNLCPSLRNRTINSLSAEFGEILEAAGVDTGKHEVNGRTRRKKTFHSLRRSFAQWLMRLGVPEEIRKDLCGHVTTAAHDKYVKRSPADLVAQLKPFMEKGQPQ